MKKIGLGIAVILFAILLELAYNHYEYLTTVIGVVGLIVAFIGFIEKKEK